MLKIRNSMIVHGYQSSPGKNWFPWLSRQLRERDISCRVPYLPNPQRPQARAWEDTVLTNLLTLPGGMNEGTVIYAHSLGCLTTLRALNRLTRLQPHWRLGALVLVAGFPGKLAALPALDEFIGAGISHSELQKLAPRIGTVAVIASDADVFVPQEDTAELGVGLGKELLILNGSGHFMGSEGIVELPEALDLITRQAQEV